MIKYVFVSMLMVLAIACEKEVDKNVEIQLRLKDQFNQEALANVSVELYFRSPGATFRKMASSTTNSAGNVVFAFERKEAELYQLRFDGTDVFTSELDIASDVVHEAKNYSTDVSLKRRSYVSIHLFNESPASPSDEVRVGLKKELECACCPKAGQSFGGVVDSNYICPVPAGGLVELNIVSTGNSGLVDTVISFNCAVLDTCDFVYVY